MEIRTIGVDLGKTVFHLASLNGREKSRSARAVVFERDCPRLRDLSSFLFRREDFPFVKELTRNQTTALFERLNPCPVTEKFVIAGAVRDDFMHLRPVWTLLAKSDSPVECCAYTDREKYAAN